MLRRSFIFHKVSRVWPKGSTSAAVSHFPEGHYRSPSMVDPAALRGSDTSAKEQRVWNLAGEAWGSSWPRYFTPPAFLTNRFHHSINRIKVYANLIRFDRPQGWMLLVLPCYWGSSLAVTQAMVWEGADPLVLFAPFIPLHTAFSLLAGAYLMRSAGCIVNDMWDHEIDKNVARTKGRPLASGEASFKEAFCLILAHVAVAGVVGMNLPPAAFAVALAATPIAIIYPFMKRITYLPQLVLGLCFNLGIFVGYAAVLGRVDVAVCLPAYIGGVIWTVLYDTIYAYQDRDDDIKTGVKSLAVWIGDQKYILHAMLMPIAACFLISGFMVSQSLPYYIGVMICMYYLHVTLDNVNIFDRWSCAQFFKHNVRFALYIFFVMCLGNLLWAFASEHEMDKDDKTNTLKADSPLSRFLFLEQKTQPLLYNAENFNWFDRMIHPAFVQAEIAKSSGSTEPPPIPAWMRREHISDNMAIFMRFCGVSEEKIAEVQKWWYSNLDQYNMFSKLQI
ncbi:unnamed protein product [Phytomonas sp. Hart1]|nr:unnamed protein product [Phytomonas sp. Hart1]|eukprot:CCW68683.1 unnamed protein product [Phytomonas sp. isolate Hart1]